MLPRRYADLFAHAGAARFAALSLLMRMPIGTVGLSTLLYVREMTGSIAFAGSVVGAQLCAAAATAPIVGRLIDRNGPRTVLLVTGTVSPLALLAMLLAGPLGLQRPAILATAIVAGASMPPVTVLVRTLWRMRLEDAALRQTAFALDAVLLEIAYTVGPATIATTIAIASPIVAMALALAWATAAVPLLFASGGLGWWRVQAIGERHLLGPLREPRLLRIYAATFALTTAFGALEVGYPGFAQAARSDPWGPALIAINSIGSAIGGLVYGGVHLATPLYRQVPLLMGLFALPIVLHLPVSDPWVLAPLALVAGALIAPAMTTVSLSVSTYAPAECATEAFTWSSTAIVTGVGAGMTLGGLLVERHGANGAFVLAIAAALCGALVSLRRSA
jgi:predicted MFS family arabinose efflux permease